MLVDNTTKNEQIFGNFWSEVSSFLIRNLAKSEEKNVQAIA